MMDELLNCPFCGGKIINKIAGGVNFYECQNSECGAVTSFTGKKVAGIIGTTVMYEAEKPNEHWNRRASTSSMLNDKIAEIEALKAEYDSLLAENAILKLKQPVRCGDCKWKRDMRSQYLDTPIWQQCEHAEQNGMICHDNYFCSYGERKESEEL